MSKAEDLLSSIVPVDEPSLFLARPDADNEPHIVIGNDRFIVVPEELKRIAVQFDHNIETVIFDCPRYWDNHDMSQMVIYINYMRKDGVFGCCLAENIAIDDNDENIMHFTWTVSQNVTLVEGKLSWLVCIKTTDEEGLEKNHWNSELCEDMYVSEGLECVETIFAAYPDLITQLLLRMKTVEDMITEFAFIDDGKGNVTIQGVGISINFAEAYEEGKIYAVGDYCSHVGIMYKCNTEILISEPFNPNHWDQVNVASELKNCFQFVADGKTLVASAITDMKVPTDATATFEVMAMNIHSIKTGQGNAQPADVKKGKTFTNSDGNLLTGTSTADTDLVILRAQYNELSGNYDLVVSQKATLQSSYNTLKTAHDSLTAEKNSLQSSYNVLQINYNKLSTDKATLQANYDKLSTEKATLQSNYDKLNTEKAKLQSEKAALQSDYDKLSAEKATLQSNYNSLQTSYNKLNGDKTALQNDFNAYKQAVVDGLANSGLGVTTSTSASALKNLLLKEFPATPDTTPVYWFNRVTNSGVEEQVLTSGYQGEWNMTDWCCDDMNYVSGSAYTKDIWHINPICNSHTSLFGGTASGSTGGNKYATIYITQMASGNKLTANGTEITTTGMHKIDVSNTSTLNLKLVASGVIHINYIYFHN